ncbi:MAG: hypothetical protein O6940_08090 [Ignavibacteria bacterium]|nr:hypothetical protein [Ignavibacteria bacterium]
MRKRKNGAEGGGRTVKQRLNVKYDSCNTLLPPESVCGIQEQNAIFNEIP